ncbi:FAD/NAD(P)-binding domain-containing protein [Aureobasidium pullulans]|uniref:FAD/NAD(P)-binding domain-containing protein n=1 Tax=Aureobasidium pullulans TaxID=5580 RepID=A0A4S9XTF7_AURPU|nr:FAD/NAD(P)-binding domain-containing protein [Aureobasidium pullulans]
MPGLPNRASVKGDWRTDQFIELDALVVGGGFGGLYTLYKLRQLGLDAKIFEAGKALGGVWHWNRYPGARVDSEVPYYQFTVREVWKDWNWSERFPGHEELRRYFEHAAKTLDLNDYIQFETIVVECNFDETSKRWSVKTASGREVTCRYLIVAAGSSYKKHYPEFPGIEDYKGVLLHSADFPEEGHYFKGESTAVIGQGSTGVQIVQEVAKQASDLTVFLRTPNIALPMRQRPMSAAEQNQYKAIYETIFAATRKCFFGVPYWSDGKALDEVSEEERMTRWEELWARGAFAFNTANYRDCMFNQKTNDLMYEFWRNKVCARIKDQAKKDLVAPEKPPHPLGTKRPSLEQDYYECIDQDNVHLVDLKNNGIKRFVAEGVETEDGIVHKFDTVVLATGYDAITGSFTGMGLKDRQGVDLRERWKEGVKTHLGMTAPGLPDMFMVYSPQAPTALSNGTTTIEVQGDLVADMIKKMHEEGIETIEARPEAADKWAADIQEMNEQTLFPLTNSWYMGANIPGKKREQLNYLAGIETYERVCKEAIESWSGFEVTKKAEA